MKKPGPTRKDASVYKGAAVQALAEVGVSPRQIAEDLGVSVSLVDDVLHGRGRWASLKTDHQLQQWRAQQTRQHELLARELSTKALQRIEDTLPTANLSSAIIAFGVLQDKARLLAGESTQNIAIGGTVKVESEKLTDVLARLVSSLQDDTEKVLEVTAVKVEDAQCKTTSSPQKAPGLGLTGDIG